MKFSVFLFVLLLLTPLAAQASTAPTAEITSKAGFGCSLLGTPAFKVEAGPPTYTVRMSIWGEGLGQLRSEKSIEITSNLPGEYPGEAKLCRRGSPCELTTARFELASGSTIANTPISGVIIWRDAAIGQDVRLPVNTTITPSSGGCR